VFSYRKIGTSFQNNTHYFLNDSVFTVEQEPCKICFHFRFRGSEKFLQVWTHVPIIYCAVQNSDFEPPGNEVCWAPSKLFCLGQFVIVFECINHFHHQDSVSTVSRSGETCCVAKTFFKNNPLNKNKAWQELFAHCAVCVIVLRRQQPRAQLMD